jgi:hypothetical protein
MIKLKTEYKIEYLDSHLYLLNPMIGLPVVAETALRDLGRYSVLPRQPSPHGRTR